MSALLEGVSSLSQAAVLGEILLRVERLRVSRRRPVLLFDLDDTLLSTAGRHLRILKEYAAQPGLRQRYPDATTRLAEIREQDLRYSIGDTAKAAGVEDEIVLKGLRDYWFACFFDNAYLGEDRPVPGAPFYCQDALVHGARLVYLTGRDESMRSGTMASLSERGFPMPDGEVVHLMLKPTFDAPDHEFKLDAMSLVAELGEVAAGFENEPSHINLIAETFPQAIGVFLDTKHSGKPVEPRPEIRRIKNYLI